MEVTRIKSPEKAETNWRSMLFVHFTQNEWDADSIVEEKKLRPSKWHGREDRFFAVDFIYHSTWF